MLSFFLPMIPPTVTAQEQKTTVRNGKPYRYNPPEVKAAKAKLIAHLAPHAPPQPMDGPVRLMVKWLFPVVGHAQDGDYKTTRPDTDNLEKLLKDTMTHLHFWHDDAQVASEIVEKFWADKPGIYIAVEPLR